MKTISLDLRERILASYDKKQGTRQQIADRFSVSEGMVKKLLQQRRRTGDIAPRHQYSGRKPMIVDSHRRQLKAMIEKHPDMTLSELRDGLGLECTIQAVYYVLDDMGLTYKKKRCGPASKTDRT